MLLATILKLPEASESFPESIKLARCF